VPLNIARSTSTDDHNYYYKRCSVVDNDDHESTDDFNDDHDVGPDDHDIDLPEKAPSLTWSTN
jgi:hypothetical protein